MKQKIKKKNRKRKVEKPAGNRPKPTEKKESHEKT
jgi:hypothetical protein